MLDRMVSIFDSTKEVYSNKLISIGQVLVEIQEEKYLDKIQRLRNGDEEVKKTLPMVAMHGIFDGVRKKESFIEASGIIILDIDDIIDDPKEIKEDIIQNHPSVLAVMTSPSGDGIKVLYLVDQDFVSSDNYRAIGKKLSEGFDLYGTVDYLSVTDCLIMTADKDIVINHDCYPKFIYLEENFEKKETKLEPRDETKELWEDAQDFFETVLLNDIESKTSNNFHFIQVSILDLAKLGFRHPEHDLSFVIDYAESIFKPSSENSRRFQEVVEISKRYPQLEWPYKYSSKRDEEEIDLDYTDYIIKKETALKPVETTSEESRDEEGEDSFLINYSNLLKSVWSRIWEGNRTGNEISLKNFSENFRFKGSGILVITGIPGHGKTEFTDQIMVDLARLHGEKSLVVGFEQTPEEHIIKLSRKMVGKDITCPTFHKEKRNHSIIEKAVNWVTSNIKHFDTQKSGGDINKILVEAAKFKGEFDYRYLVLDPFNMLSIKTKATGPERIEEILRKLTLFSHQLGVMVILIAHPFKMKKDEKTGEYEIPDFYSVKGSSAFFEMAYHGLTVYRRDTSVLVRVLKVKQNNLGRTGSDSVMEYHRDSGRYIPLDSEESEMTGDHWDLDWIDKSK